MTGFLTVLLLAAATPPSLEAVAPPVGQRGTTFTLTLTGARLAEPQELLFYGPGVACTKLAAKSATEATATLRVAADCRLGEHPFRVRTKGGVSELRLLRVTPFPVVAETGDNDTIDKAQVVPANVSVAGALEADEADHFAVKLKKGQRLAAEVEGVRLGGEMIDAALSVYGPDGRELASVDDTALFRQDPFVTLTAPADGTYTVAVRDAAGAEARYVLHLGTFVRPAAVYPVGGRAGEKVRVTLLGDAAGTRTQEGTLPSKPDARFELYPSDGETTAPTPHPFRVSAFPNVLEAEPNDDPARATPSQPGWPVAFNGVIGRPGDRDHFRFAAKKGEAVALEAFAYRLGSPLDTVVAVLDADGRVLAANDDDETHDSRLRFTAPADGDYTVRVTDKRGQGGPLHVYRVEVDRPGPPSLAVFQPAPARKSQAGQVILVPRGNRVTACLGVRRTGFAGDVTLTPGDLPSGVHATLDPVRAGEYLVPVVFEAAPDAPLGARLVSITGSGGKVTGEFTQVIDLIHGPGDSSLHSVTASRLVVAVVEEVPFSLAVVPPATPLAADGSLEVKVKVTRAKGFTSPVEVSLPMLPPGVETPSAVVVMPDKTEAVFPLTARDDIDPGDWKFVAEGKPSSGRLVLPVDPVAQFMPGAGRRRRGGAAPGLPVSSGLAPLTLAGPRVKGEVVAAAAEQGKSARLVVRLDPATPLTGTFQATLDGLPPRVTAAPVTVGPGSREVAFSLGVAETSPRGSHPTLFCLLTGEVGGQKVVHRLARNGTLKIDPPGGVRTDAAGKPLSPLDALRREEKKR